MTSRLTAPPHTSQIPNIPEFVIQHSSENTGKKTKAGTKGFSTGRWNKLEHYVFVEGLRIFGKNWKKVESIIPTRSGTQIRSHAQKFFQRIEKEFSPPDIPKFVLETMYLPGMIIQLNILEGYNESDNPRTELVASGMLLESMNIQVN
jgi:SHAQKYF class myb-like DNA-binding protein